MVSVCSLTIPGCVCWENQREKEGFYPTGGNKRNERIVPYIYAKLDVGESSGIDSIALMAAGVAGREGGAGGENVLIFYGLKSPDERPSHAS